MKKITEEIALSHFIRQPKLLNHPVITGKGRKTMFELTTGNNLYVYDAITDTVSLLKVMQETHNIIYGKAQKYIIG
jgi:hypothetical protein